MHLWRRACLWAGSWAGTWPERLYQAESRRAVLWLPVALGIGVWLYISLPFELGPEWSLLALPLLLALIAGWARRAGWGARAFALAVVATAVGFAAASLEARRSVAPVLAGQIEETVDGRVISVTRASSGAPRATLERVTIYGLATEITPERVRIALIETELADAPRPGERIRLHARLFPPGGPVEPGGFDFRRRAFFERIGGVGYALGPVLRLPAATETGTLARLRIWLARARSEISAGLRARLSGAEAAFAAAIIVGDRAAIEEADAEALRAANLAHLLAISGLHMGILCGLVFAGVRVAFAMVPAIALRYPIKKVAAVAALLAGLAYLAVSGATVPTQRAYVMVAVALTAVLLDRPALTLRALALAAAIVLLFRPISLVDPGFQMSFAATAALIAVFERLRLPRPEGGLRPRDLAVRPLLYLAGLAISSIVAGVATAPFAAYHFNQSALYGLPANLVALPVMGLWIAPSAILAGALAPLGLSGPAVDAMGQGIGIVLAVAHTVAGWPGAVRPVPAAPGDALLAVVLGGLWLLLWRSRLRWAGLPAILFGLALWGAPPHRPDVLVAPGARLIGVMGPEGRAVDHPRAQSFAAETWARRDGAPVDQVQAAARPGLEHGRGWARADLPSGWRLEVLHGRTPDLGRLRDLCRARTLLIARHGPPLAGDCAYFGEARLAATGALAVWADADGLRIETAGGGRRLWDPPQPAQ